MTEFQPFPKIARLNRDILITEKLDGTNAAIAIVGHPRGVNLFPDYDRTAIVVNHATPDVEHHVYAQSRNKFITPGKTTDNYGFAGWVSDNAERLVETLGEGTHYGEWWGSGIQRGYGLTHGDKRFSLFNAHRWAHTAEGFDAIDHTKVFGLGVVPVLYAGPYSDRWIERSLTLLASRGSFATKFPKAEGIVILHIAARTSFKVTLEDDEAPAKTSPRNAHDLLPQTTDEAAA
ncbi:RNA ligase family protein [Frigoribacterium sp. CG_9.8]|uniref:RNA ligase family protein n=1 Tax=Frigoribacterium sp. CG_9.8 TaxID=2787733 RepID=UPI0018CA5B26|nr:RNA ligase family protein [Frigoribacterium sp. CG_9.8]MBG6106572.1 hypothetical protein [Frigoribacterium sp. CG_9.8]